MTEQERIDRETLLGRAAAVAGAVYLAPMLTSAAAAGSSCDGSLRCGPGRRGRRKCRRRGGPDCTCVDGYCTSRRCEADSRCPQGGLPCAALSRCGSDGHCACYPCTPPRDSGVWNCMNFRSGFCADYPRCNENTGEGCPPGHRCYETCGCGFGICEVDCTTLASPRISRSIGSGPTLTLGG